MIDEPCLLCGLRGPSDNAHWPLTRRYGNATVPLCRICHRAQHDGRDWAIRALICKAPDYWRGKGEWDEHKEMFEKWLSKREYRTRTGARSTHV